MATHLTISGAASGLWTALLGLTLACPMKSAAASSMEPGAAHPGNVIRIDYHGWTDALLLRNSVVEAVIVPSIGRVMQFRFAGSQEGPFWENDKLLGTKPDAESTDWANFGGDKAWPAPQANWPQIASRGWPPPGGFDGLPQEAVVEGPAVILVSPVDPSFGIGMRRRIELRPGQPVMTITTRYEKASGPPVEVSVWIITQLKNPVTTQAIFADPQLPRETEVRQLNESPAAFQLERGRLTLARDPDWNHKIGVRSATLVWIGEKEILRIDSPLVADGKYPDNGSSAEIYTNAGPLAYVELEMLGPLEKMAIGDKIERVSTYTLKQRAENDPATESKRSLER